MTASAVWQIRNAGEIAEASRDAMVRTLDHEMEIEITHASEDAVLIGAFQRASEIGASVVPVFQRGTGGCAVRIGEGTLHVLIAIARLDCDESKILNVHVRPLLRALTIATGMPARYFGRDWIDIASHPTAHIGFAHERKTGRTVVESFIAIRTPFAFSRSSYLDKAPTTLEALTKKNNFENLERAIRDAYGHAYVHAAGVCERAARVEAQPAWRATVDESIGPIHAGRDETGRMRIGGEWMASFDAVSDLEARIAAGEPIRSAVDAAFTAPHTALFGVRTLESFASALEAAFR